MGFEEIMGSTPVCVVSVEKVEQPPRITLNNIIEHVRTEFNDVFLLKTRNILPLIVATTHRHNTIKISEFFKIFIVLLLKKTS
jgi:hypothetical protein